MLRRHNPSGCKCRPDRVHVNKDISEQEIRKAIISVKTNKSAGYDSIQNEMLKKWHRHNRPILKICFSLPISQWNVPFRLE